MTPLTVIASVEVVLSASLGMALYYVYLRRSWLICIAALSVVYIAGAIQGVVASVGPDEIRIHYNAIFGGEFDDTSWHLIKENIDLSINTVVNALTIGAAVLFYRSPNRAVRDIATWAGTVCGVVIAIIALPDEKARDTFDILDSIITGSATAAIGWGIVRFASGLAPRGVASNISAVLYFLASPLQAAYWLILKFLPHRQLVLELYSVTISVLMISAGTAALVLFTLLPGRGEQDRSKGSPPAPALGGP